MVGDVSERAAASALLRPGLRDEAAPILPRGLRRASPTQSAPRR